MDILRNPHIFSDLVLSFTSLFIFFRYFKQLTAINQWLWGIFLFSIALVALVDLLVYAGVESLENVREIVIAGEMTLGAMCLVSASWCLIMRYDGGRFLLLSTVALGLLLFYCITWVSGRICRPYYQITLYSRYFADFLHRLGEQAKKCTLGYILNDVTRIVDEVGQAANSDGSG